MELDEFKYRWKSPSDMGSWRRGVKSSLVELRNQLDDIVDEMN